MAHIEYRVGGKNPDEAEQPRLRTDARYAKVPAVDVDGPLNHHPGECGRWVYRPKDAHPHPGTMEGCREPVRSMGYRAAFGDATGTAAPRLPRSPRPGQSATVVRASRRPSVGLLPASPATSVAAPSRILDECCNGRYE